MISFHFLGNMKFILCFLMSIFLISILGESTLQPPKIVVTKIKITHLIFLGTCGHHILDYFCSFQVYCINFTLKLIYLKRNSNKHLQTWTYEIYLCRKNTCHIVWKICKYTSKLRLWVEFCNEFFDGEWYWCTSTKFKTI